MHDRGQRYHLSWLISTETPACLLNSLQHIQPLSYPCGLVSVIQTLSSETDPSSLHKHIAFLICLLFSTAPIVTERSIIIKTIQFGKTRFLEIQCMLQAKDFIMLFFFFSKFLYWQLFYWVPPHVNPRIWYNSHAVKTLFLCIFSLVKSTTLFSWGCILETAHQFSGFC